MALLSRKTDPTSLPLASRPDAALPAGLVDSWAPWRQRLAVLNICGAVSVTAILGWVFLTLGDPVLLRFQLAMLLTATAGFGVALGWTALAWRREHRRAIASRGLVCPRCLYDLRETEPLRGIPPNGAEVLRCPECGLVATPELLRRAWRLPSNSSADPRA